MGGQPHGTGPPPGMRRTAFAVAPPTPSTLASWINHGDNPKGRDCFLARSMKAEDDDAYPCASLDELAVVGRKLIRSNKFLQQPYPDRLVLKPIRCTGFDYEEIRGIFEDARRIEDDYSNRWFLLDVMLFILQVIQQAHPHFRGKHSELQEKYGFSDERSDRSCIARIYFHGWRLHENEKGKFFVLRFEYS